MKRIFNLFVDTMSNIILLHYKIIFSAIDSILNFDKFKEQVILFKKRAIKFYFSGFGDETQFYGYYKNLLKFAGINSTLAGIIVEHGVNFDESDIKDYYHDKYFSYIFQGDYKLDKVDKFDKCAVGVAIGPYIHYVEDYYDKDKFDEIKRTIGKTLLVFPNHTYEGINISRDVEKYYKYLVDNYDKDYDTILVCVYWNDIFDPVFDRFSNNKKVKLVSAGMRFDDKFSSRLRTIIKLSDYVIANEIGTFLGYAIYFNKPIKLIDLSDVSVDCSKTGNESTDIFTNNRTMIFDAINNNDKNKVNQIYKKFWGGDYYIKSKSELKKIIIDLHCNYKKNAYKRYFRIIKKLNYIFGFGKCI